MAMSKKIIVEILDSSISYLERHAAPRKNFQDINDSDLTKKVEVLYIKILKKSKLMFFASNNL